MSKQKVGKRRLDKYYYLAKEKGYRARSAFKLIQLNKRFNFLNCTSLIDLCAAPGGWCQVAREFGVQTVIGIDLFPIKYIPDVHTIVADITSDECAKELRNILNDKKVDIILNDGAPNVGTSWTQDAFVQNELVLSAARLASMFLRPGGSFLTKIFRSKDYFSILFVLNQLFEKVEVTKPLSSRSESAEIFAFCSKFKDAEIDDQLFNSEKIFKDNDEEKIYFFREICFEDFLNSSDPRTVLESYSKIKFDSENNEFEIPEKYMLLCEDLKLLSEVDKKNLLKLRIKILKQRYKEELTLSDESEEGDESYESDYKKNEKLDSEDIKNEKIEKIKKLIKKKEKSEKKIDEYKKLKIVKNELIKRTYQNDEDNKNDEYKSMCKINFKEQFKNSEENKLLDKPCKINDISSDEESYELNDDEKRSIIELKTDKDAFIEKTIDRRAHDEKLPDFYEEEEVEYNARGFDEDGLKEVKRKQLITTRRMRRAEKFMKEMVEDPDCDQSRLLKKSIRRTRKKPKLVVSSKGRVAKRPKGPCKLVDRRMKKDLRALKRKKK
ncbi:AdoMet-dependent rRNA methyltransferase spb1 [Dictyocoela muelleri]|nr:AdoMet-dependent rRNA methyltransferase spb1 [Dictyocoela muelleri]